MDQPNTSRRKACRRAAATAGALAFAASLAAPADAQSAPVAAADTTGLEEVVVTARKRREALQDIPGAVSAITSEVIDEVGGLIDPLQLGGLLPGVTIDDENLPEYKIRGAGAANNNLSDPSTAQLRNGADVAGGFGGRTLTRIDQFDTEQVELYRGAQGSMYGRNAVGGVINIVNKQPKEYLEWNALASLDIDKRQWRAEGVLNVPLVDDRLFLRTGVQYLTEDGLYRNLLLKEPMVPTDSLGLRVALRYLVSEATDATLFIDFEDYENENYADTASRRAGVAPETFLTVGAVDIYGQPLPSQGAHPVNAPYDQYRQALDTSGFYRQKTANINLTVNHSLPFATLQSITNYRDRNFDTLYDGDSSYVGGPALTVPTQPVTPNSTRNDACVRVVANAQRQVTSLTTSRQCTNAFDTESTTLSQEFRLVSPGDRRFQWLAGVDYRSFRNPIVETRDGRFPNTAGTGSIANFRSDARLRNEQYGAFVSADFDIMGGLNIAGSLRYSSEKKAIRLRVFQIDTTPEQLETRADESDTFESVDPTLTLSYDFGDHLVYASAARAARSGGYNRASGTASAPASIAGTPVPLRYEDETVDTLELGFKGEVSLWSAPIRYAIAAYDADYDDILRNAVVLAGADSGDGDTVILGTQLVNLGDARVRGVDVELSGMLERFLWTKGSLRWSAAYNYADGEILSGPSAGLALQDLPRDSYNGNLMYRLPLAASPAGPGLGSFFVGVDGEYESGKTTAASSVPGDARRRLNARLGFDGKTGGRGWQVTLFADNVLNFDYAAANANLTTYEGTPAVRVSRQLKRYVDERTIGIRFTINSRPDR